MYYTRNRDLNYYNTDCSRANCGSYALRLNEWYDPEDYVERIVGNTYDWIEELYINGYSEWEIATIYGEIMSEGILREFSGELESCEGEIIEDDSVELIALCTWCIYEEDVGSDWDFHFKVYRDGKWMEKNGVFPVHECSEDDWGRYNSDVFYFYHWLGEEDE